MRIAGASARRLLAADNPRRRWLRTVGERIQQPGGLFPGDEIEPPSISFGPASAVIYRKYFDKDAALARRLQPLMVGEPSGEATLHILQGLGKRYEQHHKCVLRPIAFRPSSISASAIGNGAPIGRPLGGATVGGAIQMGDKVSIQLESGQVAFHSQRT